jgi:NADPH-dependent curcumin reductase CurA
MLPKHYTRIVLAERPKTHITPATFRKETVASDGLRPGPGDVLVRVDWLSLDPAMRGWIKDVPSYIEPVQIGAVMRSSGLGTIIEAGEGCELRPGDIVYGFTGETQEFLDSLLLRPVTFAFRYLRGRTRITT